MENKFKFDKNGKLKEKFVILPQLKFLVLNNSVRNEETTMVPYYKAGYNKNIGFTLNIFDEKGTIDISKIKYVTIDIPEIIASRINFNRYQYKENIIKTKKEKDELGRIFVKVSIPYRIFEMIMMESMTSKYFDNNDRLKLSEMLLYATDEHSIALHGKNNKIMAYVIQI